MTRARSRMRTRPAEGSGRPDLRHVVRAGDQALPREEADSQRLVLAWRAHRHRERLAVDAHLERLLDGQLVAVVPALGPPDALDRRTRHVTVEGRVHPQIIAPRGRETTR